ncbi:MAG: M42 family peptidase [Oscillospiraceae bacterium]|nr:M42 family peptidase [Oscillospiraceae bacterium]
MLHHLKNLCALPGVSGDEAAVRDYILAAVRPHAAPVVDTLGNILIAKKGMRNPGKTVLLTAHMDEVGFVIMSVTSEGWLRFAPVGGVDRRVILGARLRIGPNGVPGIVGLKPVHLTTAEERGHVPEPDTLYIDIGASTAEEAKTLVAPGDTACFDSPPFEMGHRLAAKAIDNRVGCAVLLQLIEEDLPIDVHIAFTVQEEVGSRGAQTASFQVQPDVALIIESTTAADLPGVPEDKQVCRLGGGVVVPFMDGSTIYDRGLYTQITTLATRLGIPWQTKSLIAGGTDASGVQRAGGGVRVAALAAPARNLHAGYSVADVRDVVCVAELARAVLGEV